MSFGAASFFKVNQSGVEMILIMKGVDFKSSETEAGCFFQCLYATNAKHHLFKEHARSRVHCLAGSLQAPISLAAGNNALTTYTSNSSGIAACNSMNIACPHCMMWLVDFGYACKLLHDYIYRCPTFHYLFRRGACVLRPVNSIMALSSRLMHGAVKSTPNADARHASVETQLIGYILLKLSFVVFRTGRSACASHCSRVSFMQAAYPTMSQKAFKRTPYLCIRSAATL